MNSPSLRDLEQLSAFLDGQLAQSEKTHLEARIKSDPALADALEDLRQTRALLRRTPHRRAPHNFTLTPRMAGIQPPVPRLVPVFSWASAAAMLLFIFTLGAGLLSQLSFGAAATMAPVTAYSMGAGQAAPAPEVPAPATPVTAAPFLAPAVNTQTPAADQAILATTTPEASVNSVPEISPPNALRAVQPKASSKAGPSALNPWLIIWPALALFLGAIALLVWRLNKRAFEQKNPRE